MNTPEKLLLPTKKTEKDGRSFLHILELLVDDCIQLAQTTDEKAAIHYSKDLLHRIHRVVSPTQIIGHDGEDPTPMKNLLEEERVWDCYSDALKN